MTVFRIPELVVVHSNIEMALFKEERTDMLLYVPQVT